MTDMMICNAIFSDGHFERIALGNMLNKGGAAGKIYSVSAYPEMVAKIFHDKTKSKTNRLKLEAMIQNRPNIPTLQINGKKFVQIAWPEAVLEDDEGFCVGYLMPLINTSEAVSLDHLMQKAVRKKEHLTEKYEDRLTAAFNVTAMVAALHQCGHYIVDLKPANVSVYKENMAVAMFDCDGFSIKGENTRYPAEYVSEEYIYPEGMNQNPEDMGEDQDNFALAVIIFRLLNNGIHPFAGTPLKKDGDMLDIQTRIEQYHYAYGLWPDTYQEPHPYSIHGYFDKKTLDMFERAFAKKHKRPTAKEWYEHLKYLSEILKPCKKNPDHGYFTNKGCGLCAVEEKFRLKINEIKEEKAAPQKIRGFEVSTLTTEKTEALKKEKKREFVRLNKMAMLFIVCHLVLWAGLPIWLYQFKDMLTSRGYFVQMLAIILVLKGVFFLLDHAQKKLPLLQNQVLINMLKIYTLFNSVVGFLIFNQIGWAFFKF